MDSPPSDPINVKPGRASHVVYGLIAIAVSIGVVALLGFFAGALLISGDRENISAVDILALAGLLVLALAGGGLTIAAVKITRQLGRLLKAIQVMERRLVPLPTQHVDEPQENDFQGIPPSGRDEWQKLLAEIREALLLPEQERSRRFKKMVKQEFREQSETIDHHIASRDFHRAREVLDRLAERFGKNEQIIKMQERLKQETKAAQTDDITQTMAHIEDLIGLAHWDEAERSAKNLADKYPEAETPTAIIDRIRKEQSQFEKKQRQRSHEEIQQLVNERQWPQAVEATYRFIQSYPTGPDTDALREQLEILESNADIKTRQEIEKQIKEHLEQHKYWEALALARRIISEHPFSPQASALRSQLPRIETLAKQQKV